MDMNIAEQPGISPTGLANISVVADPTSSGTVGLYASAAVAQKGDGSAYDYDAVVTSYAGDGLKKLDPNTVTLAQPLPVNPDWDIVLSGGGKGEIAYTVFGGAWSMLQVGSLADGKLTIDYSYEIEATNFPSFVLNSSATAAKQQYVSAIFSGYQLGVIGLETRNGEQTPAILGLVGTSQAPVSRGRVWGDLSNGLPSVVSLVYKVDKKVGPLTPDGMFQGSLFFATFDNSVLSTPLPFLEGVEIGEFDLAVSGDIVCVLAVTGDGAPLVVMLGADGKALGSPNIPAGSWNNAGRWVANPTITATPGTETAFTFAFIEMEGGVPIALYSGTLSPPVITP